MPAKTVTLTVDAYDALAAAKREGESFSDVVKRLAGPTIRLTDFAGAWRRLPRKRLAETRSAIEKMDALSVSNLEALGRRSREAQPR